MVPAEKETEPMPARLNKIVHSLMRMFKVGHMLRSLSLAHADAQPHAPPQIENLPTRPKSAITPLTLRRQAFAKRWSPLDVRYMPRGDLPADIPHCSSSLA